MDLKCKYCWLVAKKQITIRKINLTLSTQFQQLKSFYEEWINHEVQTDDIVIFGFKVPQKIS